MKKLANSNLRKGSSAKSVAGSGILPATISGARTLQQLAMEHPKRFLRPIVRQYCAFVRHPPKSDDGKTVGKGDTLGADSETLREDVRAVMDAILDFSGEPKTCKVLNEVSPDLRGANLPGFQPSDSYLPEENVSGADLSSGNLTGANLSKSDLSQAWLDQTNLSQADLSGADLSNAFLFDANLFRAFLTGANLSKTNLSGVQELTQDQLDKACADPLHPPTLGGAVGS